MASGIPQSTQSRLWSLSARQHGVVARPQLLDLGFADDAIKHRIAVGRLHPVARGVYAVGRPQLSRHGRWMAALLGCGPGAALSHLSAAAVWGIGREGPAIEIVVPAPADRRRPGVVVHRCRRRADEVVACDGLRVTTPVCTIIDLASRVPRDELEAVVAAADKLGLTDPEALREATESGRARPGVARLRAALDRRTFALTDSALERRFLPLARRAGLPKPRTGQRVNGFRVDFFWPDLGLIVETDGLRYHRTPAQQSRDRLRDQAHAVAGLTSLRFTYEQVVFAPAHVQATLRSVATRLKAPPHGSR